MRVTRNTLTAVAIFILLGAPAGAQAPSPIDPVLFAFPGDFDQPPSAVSAGRALADAWLGEEPYGNPASDPGAGVVLSPALLRLNRQDLRAGNRNFDETPAFLDGAGAAFALDRVPLWIYVHQPAVRSEDFAFSRGTGLDPTVAPATLYGQAEMRETRAGLAAAWPVGGVRWGAAIEWMRRSDRYWTREISGAPEQGERLVEFDGEGVGFSAGARYASADSGAGRWSVGAAVRRLPSIDVSGTQTFDLLSGASESPVASTLTSGWEGGVSVRYDMSVPFRAFAGVGGRTGRDWEGFGLRSGESFAWRLALEYDDPGDPVAVRIGFSRESQEGAPEDRAGALGLGLGWNLDDVTLEIGVLHRALERPGRPRSYDDRVVGSVRVVF